MANKTYCYEITFRPNRRRGLITWYTWHPSLAAAEEYANRKVHDEYPHATDVQVFFANTLPFEETANA